MSGAAKFATCMRTPVSPTGRTWPPWCHRVQASHDWNTRFTRRVRRGGLGLADVRDRRVGGGAPGDVQRAQLLPAEEEGVLDHDACGRIGHVRELVLHADVARGVDAPVGGLQAVVHQHTARRVVLDADRLEAEALDVGRAARPDPYLVHRDLPRRALHTPALPPAPYPPELGGEGEA